MRGTREEERACGASDARVAHTPTAPSFLAPRPPRAFIRFSRLISTRPGTMSIPCTCPVGATIRPGGFGKEVGGEL